jgi:predicted PurR-regulated permease PerM
LTLNPLLAQYGFNLTLDIGNLKSQIIKYLSTNREDWMDPVIASLKLGGSFALAAIGNFILIPVVLFYLLSEWDRWVSHVVAWVPVRWRPNYDSFMNECDAVLGQYLRGQILVMLVLSVFYALALMMFGLDLALPIGVFTGLAVCVPYLGFGLGLILALLAGLLQFASFKAVIMVAVATRGNPPPNNTEHCKNEEIIFTEASVISRCSDDKSNLATPFISTC